ncbi:MAG: PBP1A family penicillin-binding protein [Candidatus Obscuribacterales bacterium]|nr:PBP1A family penicillin-binding protein [Candidatus Obscuribacterales bacterium]
MKPQAMKQTGWTKQKIVSVAVASAACAGACLSLPSLLAAVLSSGLWLPPELDQSSKGLAIYDRHDRYLCTVFKDTDKEPVPLSQVSKSMRNAILAAEDHNFYKHAGLDAGAIARASLRNIQAGKVVEGASTITQQLARNLYIKAPDRSYTRKLYEAFLALQIESRYKKDEILQAYLNEIYFGNGAYGIERAANKYFNKHASKLTISESAFLAGLVRSPSALSLRANEMSAEERRNGVIASMHRYNYITASEYKAALASKPVFHRGSHRLRYPRYISHVVALLRKELGDSPWSSGYKVYTHLDPALQTVAEKTLNAGLRKGPKGLDQGALVTMKLSDGAILSMVGGLGNYESNQYNRALTPHTAGSSFKPFVYLSGLLDGTLATDTLVADTPLIIKSEGAPDFVPRNYDGSHLGWMTVRDAIARSRNICALRVAQSTGMSNVISTARSAGIKTRFDLYPSIALGACAISPLDMTVAYGTIARAGTRYDAQFLRKVVSMDGCRVRNYEATPSRCFPEEPVAKLIDALEDVVQRGTGTRARLRGIPVAGKTGTADKGKDLWFVGFTPEYVTTVWAGSDKQKAVNGRHVTGGEVLAGLWKQYMTKLYGLHKPTPKLAFAEPRIPLLRSIPMFSDESLLGYSTQDAYSAASTNSTEPIVQTTTIKVDREVNSSGIASALEVQKVAATRRREIATMKAWQTYRASALHDAQQSGTITPAMQQSAPIPRANDLPKHSALLPHQRTIKPLLERGMNHIQDPSTEKPKEDTEEKKKPGDDEEESEESEEFVLSLNQYRRRAMKAEADARRLSVEERWGVRNYSHEL